MRLYTWLYHFTPSLCRSSIFHPTPLRLTVSFAALYGLWSLRFLPRVPKSTGSAHSVDAYDFFSSSGCRDGSFFSFRAFLPARDSCRSLMQTKSNLIVIRNYNTFYHAYSFIMYEYVVIHVYMVP